MTLGVTDSLSYWVPEFTLVAGVLLLLLLELLVRRKDLFGEVALLAVAASVLAAAARGGGPYGSLFNGMVALDSFAVFFKIVLGLAAFGAIWMSIGARELDGQHPGEYYVVLLSCTLGMYTMAAATNLLVAYLALEFVSQTSYILTGFLKGSRRSSEAALKYLIYGGVASGVMVYGMTLLYGLTGSLDYSALGAGLAGLDSAAAPAAFVAIAMVLVGFGYKIAMVPFHMWAPDVYEGAPLPVAAYLAVGSKAAGMAMLVRFFYPGISTFGGEELWNSLAGIDWPDLVAVAAMVTMTVGNLAALRQDNVKRLLAYSSIAHAGYMLMGVVALTNTGLMAVLFYVVVYYLMNLGAFAVLLAVVNRSGREDIAGLRGLAWRGGAVPAAAMAIFLLSLAGIPPLAGFIGKFYLFAAVIERHMWTLAVVAAANSVVALYYYARILRAMYLEAPDEGAPPVELGAHQSVLVGALVAGTLVFGVYWAPLVELAQRSIFFATG
ncbi:MAG: NADH-quinone oxidoreductase subunit N [Candidatus Dadabacteria bacterium]|nr:MAG: NADH-quinone oxidoreductase subunit N [Candidatus Dadabacteria bacterium]